MKRLNSALHTLLADFLHQMTLSCLFRLRLFHNLVIRRRWHLLRSPFQPGRGSLTSTPKGGIANLITSFSILIIPQLSQTLM